MKFERTANSFARSAASTSTLLTKCRLRDGGVEEAVQFVWALLHGLVSLRINRPDYAWSKRILEISVDAALRGLVLPVGGDGGRIESSTR